MSVVSLSGARVMLNGRAVLDGADLTLTAGQLTVVVGPNGSGKTTLLRAALGLAPLTAGEARLGGDPVQALGHRQRAERAAYLPQDRRIVWNMPAVEVAALGAPSLSGEAALERARDALALLGADHLAERGVGEMSGGERARVLLARALTAQAQALLADEPTSDLDPDAQLMVLEVLHARARAGQAVCLSLHDLNLAARYADEVVVMHGGRVAAKGAPLDALTPAVLKVVFGLTGLWVQTPDGPLLSARRAA